MSIAIKPRDSETCVFEVEATLSNTATTFKKADCPHGSEMADAILGLPAVEEVVVDGGTVTVTKNGGPDWRELEEPIAYALQLGMAPAAPVALGAPPAPVAIDEDELFDSIEEFIAREINPAVASHGGKIELIDIQDMTLVVRMMGGCQGCGMANVTLKQGIESSVRKTWPMIQGIRDVTDHASGTDPYFQAEKK